MTPPKEHDDCPVTNTPKMEICNLFNREFKIVVLKMLTNTQENTEKLFNCIWKGKSQFPQEV